MWMCACVYVSMRVWRCAGGNARLFRHRLGGMFDGGGAVVRAVCGRWDGWRDRKAKARGERLWGGARRKGWVLFFAEPAKASE